MNRVIARVSLHTQAGLSDPESQGGVLTPDRVAQNAGGPSAVPSQQDTLQICCSVRVGSAA